jgi:mono/diheme cytochrome c family protein
MSQHGEKGHGGEAELPADAPVQLPMPPLPRPPFWMIAVALVGVVVTWLPLAIIARARVSTSPEPRIQIMQDMGKQPKFREQETNPLFADGRAARPKVPGTVARGDLEDDVQFYQGFERVRDASGKWTVKYFDGLPPQFTSSPEHLAQVLKRGQERFNIYCYVCHGLDGSGRGPVNQRALELKSNGAMDITWIPAATLTADTISVEPDGKIFNTITNGIRTMPSYGSQIPTADRWAIVSYVRALQFSQKAPERVVPPDKRSLLQDH